MATVTNEELVETYGISAEEVAELESQADAFDAGEWPEGKVTRVGRPKSIPGQTRPITVRLSVDTVEEVDRLAASRGVSRGVVFREAVDLLLKQV